MLVNNLFLLTIKGNNDNNRNINLSSILKDDI